MPIDFLNVPRPGMPREAGDSRPLEWGSELAGNPIHSRPPPPKDLQEELPTLHPNSLGPHPGTFGKVPSQTRGAPGASEPELYKIIGVRGPPFLHPPFLCRKTRETISYDQNYAELVEICPVSQAGVPAGLPPCLPAGHLWCPGSCPTWLNE